MPGHRIGYRCRRGDVPRLASDSDIDSATVSGSLLGARPRSPSPDAASTIARHVLDADVAQARIRAASEAALAAAESAITRSGPYASDCVPVSSVLSRVLDSWAAVRYSPPDRLAVDTAIQSLRSLLSPEADLLLQVVRPSGNGPHRTYTLIGPLEPAVVSALRLAVQWGLALRALAEADATLEKDTASAFLDEAVKTPVAVAAWREIQRASAKTVFIPGSFDVARLADHRDPVVLGLHAVTLPPTRLRPFFNELSDFFGSQWAKLNKHAVVGPGVWQRRFRGSPAPTNSRTGHRATRRGRGGRGSDNATPPSAVQRQPPVR